MTYADRYDLDIMRSFRENMNKVALWVQAVEEQVNVSPSLAPQGNPTHLL